MANDPLLRLRDFSLARREGNRERTLLAGIDLELRPGSWTALLGANGAGKSSLLKYLAADDSPVADRAAIMFQDPDDQLVAFSVDAELELGQLSTDTAALRREYGLGLRGGLPPRLLSAGQKQRLVLAVSLAQTPTVLLCDEPTALQDAGQAAWILDRLDRWRHESGGALVTATCDRVEAARADELLVLEAGRIVLRGTPEDCLGAAPVRALLDPLPAVAYREPVAGASPVLEVSGVEIRFGGPTGGLGPFNLRVEAGERVGLTGPNGCGKSTLLATCAGLRRPDAGEVRVTGRTFYTGSGRDLDHGLALLAPQFPEYMFTAGSVAGEVALDPALARFDPARLGLPADLMGRDPHALSTGQRRRLALGLVLASGRPLLLLDEPAAALDCEGRRRVLAMLDTVPAGAAVVVASHNAEFLAAAGCRTVDLGASA